MKRFIMLTIAVAALAVLALSGCSHDSPPAPTGADVIDSPDGVAAADGDIQQGAINFKVSFVPLPRRTGKTAAVEAVDAVDAVEAVTAVSAYVYDSRNVELTRQALTVANGRATGEINLAAQNGLRVVLTFLDGGNPFWIGEDTSVDLPAGGTVTAEIVAQSMNNHASAPAEVNVGEDYTVEWMSRPYTTSYELQEARTSDFATPQTIYNGTETGYVVPGKTESGVTWYYRVRGYTDYGPGPWSVAQTGIGGTGGTGDGTIVIDVPIPDDDGGTNPPPATGAGTHTYLPLAQGNAWTFDGDTLYITGTGDAGSNTYWDMYAPGTASMNRLFGRFVGDVFYEPTFADGIAGEGVLFDFSASAGSTWITMSETGTDANGNTYTNTKTVTALGSQSVTVPAGTFDCMAFTVTMTNTYTAEAGTTTIEKTESWWFARNIGPAQWLYSETQDGEVTDSNYLLLRSYILQ